MLKVLLGSGGPDAFEIGWYVVVHHMDRTNSVGHGSAVGTDLLVVHTNL